MISTVVSLYQHSTWDPSALAKSSICWPHLSELVGLQEFAMPLPPSIWVNKGSQVITPSSLDSSHGNVFRRSRNYEGTGFQVSDTTTGLSVGDLLVPLRSDIPVLLLSEQHAGAFVAGSFLALKPSSKLWSVWLWAILNSATGKRIRTAHSAGAVTPIASKSALLELPVPTPPSPDSWLWDALYTIEQSTRRPEVEAVDTWWRTTDLSGANWGHELAMRIPLTTEGSVPLEDYCSRIELGKEVPESSRFEHKQPQTLPYADGSFLSGKSSHSWATEGLVAEPGDILVASIGPRPNAKLAHEQMIVGSSIYVLRPNEPGTAASLTEYLNSQEGYDRRQMYLSGVTRPRISLQDLKQLGVVEDKITNSNLENQSTLPLASLLESTLWD